MWWWAFQVARTSSTAWVMTGGGATAVVEFPCSTTGPLTALVRTGGLTGGAAGALVGPAGLAPVGAGVVVVGVGNTGPGAVETVIESTQPERLPSASQDPWRGLIPTLEFPPWPVVGEPPPSMALLTEPPPWSGCEATTVLGGGIGAWD